MLVKFVQYPNASSSMLVTLAGIVILAKLVQYQNVPAPMLLRFVGTVTLFSPEQH
jgi:hypothetical protein